MSTRASSPDEIEKIQGCYGRLARQVNGFLDRSEVWWRVWAIACKERRIYVAEGENGEIEGYVVYRQIDGEGAGSFYGWRIETVKNQLNPGIKVKTAL